MVVKFKYYFSHFMLHSQSNIIGGQCSELATIRQRIQILNGVGLNTNFKFVKQS